MVETIRSLSYKAKLYGASSETFFSVLIRGVTLKCFNRKVNHYSGSQERLEKGNLRLWKINRKAIVIVGT